MKIRKFAFILSFLIITNAILISCSTKDAHVLAHQALGIMDEYFDGKITSESGSNKLEKISNEMDKIDYTESNFSSDEYRLITSDIVLFSGGLTLNHSDSELMQYRDDLASLLVSQ